MKKKILFVIPILSPYHIYRFSEMANNKVIDLHIVVEIDKDKDRPGWKFQRIPGCKMYLLKRGIDHRYIQNRMSDGYMKNSSHHISIGISRIVKKINPDLVIVCNSMQLASLVFFRRYKLAVIVEDTLRAAQGRKKINAIIKRELLRKADAYFAFSEDAELFLKANGITMNIFRTSWSVDLSFFQSVKDKEKIKQKLSIDNEKRNFIIVSSLIPLKGIKPFLNVWKNMDEFFTQNSVLRIIGDGPLLDDLQNFCKDSQNIMFLGNLPYEEVSIFLQCSDVFILPTLEDLCSLVVFEAMAAGLPVLTTIFNGAKFLIDEGKNGYIFDSTDNESIRNVLTLISESDLSQMSANSLEIISQYDNKIVIKKFVEMLLEIING